MSILTIYCKAIAGHLESNLKQTQILSWSDLLDNVGRAKQRSRIAIGISGRQYSPMAVGHGYNDLLTCTLEMQAEIFGSNGKPANHDEMIDFTYRAEREILYGFQPFAEFSPLRPLRGGNIKNVTDQGSFVYSSEFTTAIAISAGEPDRLSPISETLEPKIVSLSLFNDWNPQGTADRIW